MLVSLTVRDLGLIERAELELGPGLQVITGETGVGKSMLLHSLSLLRGERPSADWIRTGCDEALVSGLFVVSEEALRLRIAEATGMELEDGELLIERRLSRQGRHRCRLNGREVPASLLRAAGERLIEIHGQQSQLSLLDPQAQLDALDRFAALGEERAEYATRFRRARALESHLEATRADSDSRRERRLALEHLVGELDAADPSPGERDRLEEELRLLEDRDHIGQRIAAIRERFHESEGSLVDELAAAAREFSGLGARHRDLGAFGELCAALRDQLDEGLRNLGAIADGLDIDTAALDEMRRRFDRLVLLEERFRRRGDDLVRYREELREELASIGGAEESLPGLEAELAAEIEELGRRARALTRRRTRAAKELAARIAGELAELGMERATFEIRRRALADGRFGGLDERGADRIEWIFGPNPGEPALPLGDIASGGELSRVMLSLKRTLADADSVATLVFDEIDAGVGGRLGGALGSKLREIGARHQVLCVTHLPQLACYGERQLHVEKRVSGDRTVTTVEPLEGDRRAEEIAAMMRGAGRTERSLAEAREMLAAAGAVAPDRVGGGPARRSGPEERAC